MAITLTALEVGLLVLGVCGTVLLWVRPLLLEWVDVAAYIGRALILALSCVVSFYYNDLYDMRKVKSFGVFSARMVESLGILLILMTAFYALFPDLQLAKIAFLSSLLALAGLVLLLRAALYTMMKARGFAERVLILGTGPLALKIAAEIEAAPHHGYSVIGFVEDGESLPLGTSSLQRYPTLGRLEGLEKITEEFHPNRLVVALAERRARLPVHQLLHMRMNGIMVEDGIEVYKRLAGKLAVESLMPSYLIFSRDFEKPRWQRALHRAISLTVAAVGLLLTWPLMGMIALLIKLDSKGSVFFVQERLGYGERSFRVMKFRTMHPVNQATSEWVRDNTDRITRVGKRLRRFRLDELPQFLNILRGDMSLVGPRPHPVSNRELFATKIPYYSLRHMVRPGITGWAQVRHGYANDLEEEIEKIRYDLYYIKHMSLWFDLLILFDTVKIVLFGRGSKEADASWANSPVGAGKQ